MEPQSPANADQSKGGHFEYNPIDSAVDVQAWDVSESKKKVKKLLSRKVMKQREQKIKSLKLWKKKVNQLTRRIFVLDSFIGGSMEVKERIKGKIYDCVTKVSDLQRGHQSKSDLSQKLKILSKLLLKNIKHEQQTTHKMEHNIIELKGMLERRKQAISELIINNGNIGATKLHNLFQRRMKEIESGVPDEEVDWSVYNTTSAAHDQLRQQSILTAKQQIRETSRQLQELKKVLAYYEKIEQKKKEIAKTDEDKESDAKATVSEAGTKKRKKKKKKGKKKVVITNEDSEVVDEGPPHRQAISEQINTVGMFSPANSRPVTGYSSGVTSTGGSLTSLGINGPGGVMFQEDPIVGFQSEAMEMTLDGLENELKKNNQVWKARQRGYRIIDSIVESFRGGNIAGALSTEEAIISKIRKMLEKEDIEINADSKSAKESMIKIIKKNRTLAQTCKKLEGELDKNTKDHSKLLEEHYGLQREINIMGKNMERESKQWVKLQKIEMKKKEGMIGKLERLMKAKERELQSLELKMKKKEAQLTVKAGEKGAKKVNLKELNAQDRKLLKRLQKEERNISKIRSVEEKVKTLEKSVKARNEIIQNLVSERDKKLRDMEGIVSNLTRQKTLLQRKLENAAVLVKRRGPAGGARRRSTIRNDRLSQILKRIEEVEQKIVEERDRDMDMRSREEDLLNIQKELRSVLYDSSMIEKEMKSKPASRVSSADNVKKLSDTPAGGDGEQQHEIHEGDAPGDVPSAAAAELGAEQSSEKKTEDVKKEEEKKNEVVAGGDDAGSVEPPSDQQGDSEVSGEEKKDEAVATPGLYRERPPSERILGALFVADGDGGDTGKTEVSVEDGEKRQDGEVMEGEKEIEGEGEEALGEDDENDFALIKSKIYELNTIVEMELACSRPGSVEHLNKLEEDKTPDDEEYDSELDSARDSSRPSSRGVSDVMIKLKEKEDDSDGEFVEEMETKTEPKKPEMVRTKSIDSFLDPAQKKKKINKITKVNKNILIKQNSFSIKNFMQQKEKGILPQQGSMDALSRYARSGVPLKKKHLWRGMKEAKQRMHGEKSGKRKKMVMSGERAKPANIMFGELGKADYLVVSKPKTAPQKRGEKKEVFKTKKLKTRTEQTPGKKRKKKKKVLYREDENMSEEARKKFAMESISISETDRILEEISKRKNKFSKSAPSSSHGRKEEEVVLEKPKSSGDARAVSPGSFSRATPKKKSGGSRIMGHSGPIQGHNVLFSAQSKNLHVKKREVLLDKSYLGQSVASPQPKPTKIKMKRIKSSRDTTKVKYVEMNEALPGMDGTGIDYGDDEGSREMSRGVVNKKLEWTKQQGRRKKQLYRMREEDMEDVIVEILPPRNAHSVPSSRSTSPGMKRSASRDRSRDRSVSPRPADSKTVTRTRSVSPGRNLIMQRKVRSVSPGGKRVKRVEGEEVVEKEVEGEEVVEKEVEGEEVGEEDVQLKVKPVKVKVGKKKRKKKKKVTIDYGMRLKQEIEKRNKEDVVEQDEFLYRTDSLEKIVESIRGKKLKTTGIQVQGKQPVRGGKKKKIVYGRQKSREASPRELEESVGKGEVEVVEEKGDIEVVPSEEAFEDDEVEFVRLPRSVERKARTPLRKIQGRKPRHQQVSSMRIMRRRKRLQSAPVSKKTMRTRGGKRDVVLRSSVVNFPLGSMEVKMMPIPTVQRQDLRRNVVNEKRRIGQSSKGPTFMTINRILSDRLNDMGQRMLAEEALSGEPNDKEKILLEILRFKEEMDKEVKMMKRREEEEKKRLMMLLKRAMARNDVFQRKKSVGNMREKETQTLAVNFQESQIERIIELIDETLRNPDDEFTKFFLEMHAKNLLPKISSTMRSGSRFNSLDDYLSVSPVPVPINMGRQPDRQSREQQHPSFSPLPRSPKTPTRRKRPKTTTGTKLNKMAERMHQQQRSAVLHRRTMEPTVSSSNLPSQSDDYLNDFVWVYSGYHKNWKPGGKRKGCKLRQSSYVINSTPKKRPSTTGYSGHRKASTNFVIHGVQK